MEVYRIKDWDKHFETHRTRPMKKLDKVLLPNKHDGDGFCELMDGHENGGLHYAAWILMLQVASKCEPRGALIRDGGRPHTAESLSRMVRLPAEVIRESLNRLCSSIEWMEVIDIKELGESGGNPAEVGGTPPESAGHCTPENAAHTRIKLNCTETELNTTELNETAVSQSVGISVGEDRKPEIHREWTKIKDVVSIKPGKFWIDDRRELFKIATLRVLGFIPEAAIEDALEFVRRKEPRPNPAFKCFKNGVAARVDGAGGDMKALLDQTAIPQWAIHLVEGTVAT